jgi:hypothetical protein
VDVNFDTLLLICQNLNTQFTSLYKGTVLGKLIEIPLCIIQNPRLESALPNATAPSPCFSISSEQIQIDINPLLNEAQIGQLSNLICEFQHCFISEGEDLPPADVLCPRVQLKLGVQPYNTKPFRHSEAEESKIQSFVDNLLKQGVIIPSNSPWTCNLFLLEGGHKQSGKPRVILDLRPLNFYTIKLPCRIQTIESILQKLRYSKYFSSIDMSRGFFQFRLHPDDQQYFSFSTEKGTYSYTVLPFGWINSPSIFSSIVNETFGPYLDKFILTYLDDIIVYSETFAEHMEHLRLALTIFSTKRMSLNAEKCRFGKTRLKLLGHIVSHKGIETNEDKIKVIRDMPPPTTVRETKAILGSGSYFRRYIKDYSKIVYPISCLVHKDNITEWGEAEQTALNKLKEALTTPPILSFFYPDRKTELRCDSSDFALGVILVQLLGKDEMVIARCHRPSPLNCFEI